MPWERKLAFPLNPQKVVNFLQGGRCSNQDASRMLVLSANGSFLQRPCRCWRPSQKWACARGSVRGLGRWCSGMWTFTGFRLKSPCFFFLFLPLGTSFFSFFRWGPVFFASSFAGDQNARSNTTLDKTGSMHSRQRRSAKTSYYPAFMLHRWSWPVWWRRRWNARFTSFVSERHAVKFEKLSCTKLGFALFDMVLFLLWMDRIHHLRNHGKHSLLLFTGNHQKPGFLRWCRISSIHSMGMGQKIKPPGRGPQVLVLGSIGQPVFWGTARSLQRLRIYHGGAAHPLHGDEARENAAFANTWMFEETRPSTAILALRSLTEHRALEKIWISLHHRTV